MEKWFIKNKKPEKIIDFKKFELNEILYKVLINRDIMTEDEVENFLNPSLENLHSALLLPDLIKAANLVLKAIRENKKIRIVGDYDVDGVTSTYILYKGLERLDANVDFDIPHRVKDGYGINKNIIERASNENVEVIITCDNGIAARNAINFANEKNIEVIVTDHHEVPIDDEGKEIFPEASAIIDPKRSDSRYPFKEICGAVVAFKFISYLYTIKSVSEDELLTKLLPYAAIATVCDVMPLCDENRDIVKFGLSYLNETSDTGISALIEECGLLDKTVDVYHIGFVIGPTINSAGRLDDAKYAVRMLLEENNDKAKEMARYLRDLNIERQNLTDEGFQKIDKLIIDNNMLDTFRVLVIKDESLNESVVGIIAGRIKEKYNRPVIVLTKSNDILKGSGRSIEGYNMFEKISEHKENLTSFGGHAMACGLSIEEKYLKDFIIDINNDADITKEDLIKKVYIDTGLKLSNTDMDLAFKLESFEPYGTGNPKAKFGTRNLNILRISVFGKNKNVLKFVLTDGNTSREAILFEPVGDFINNLRDVYSDAEIKNMFQNNRNNIFIDIIYTPTINDFRGNKSLELSIKNYRVSGGRENVSGTYKQN